jgi:hypothetical protein
VTPDREALAHAFVALSAAVLDMGAALAGPEAMDTAMDAEAASFRQAHVEPAGEWQCPLGLPDEDCKAWHDHYPTRATGGP